VIKLNGQTLKPSQPEPAEAPVNSTQPSLRWRALLIATTWARTLVQINKQKTAERQAQLPQKTQTATTENAIPAFKELKAAEPQKRSHPESETQTQASPKKRRLYRANGEQVRPTTDRQESALQPTQPISSAQHRHHRSKFFIPLDTQAKAKAPRSQGRFATQFDDTIREKVLALKRQNKSAAEIERLTGVAQRTMYSWFKAANLTQPNTVDFTPKDAKIREQALRMKREKLHTERISEKLNVPANTLRKWFQAAGLNQAREAYSKEVKAKALSRYHAGVAPAQIGPELNVPVGRIYAWVNEAGVANRKKPHSEETRQTVFKLYEQNRPFAEIVKKTGVSEATVTKWLSESGVANRRKTHDPQIREEVIARYQQNPDRHQISKDLKISVNTVKKWITKAGLTQRRQAD
jgi:transposase-like protein